MTWSNLRFNVLKVFCYHLNKSTILLFYSIFRTAPEVSSKFYLVEICYVSEKLWLCNHIRVDFGFQILDLKDHISASLTSKSCVKSTCWDTRATYSIIKETEK